MPDRRTPVEGARVGAPAEVPIEEMRTALDWVAAITVPDPTCRRILVLYATHADRTWSGQMSVQETAAALSLSRDTVVVHRAHLVGRLCGASKKAHEAHGDACTGPMLVRFERDSARSRRGDRYIGRRVDCYVLQSGLLVMNHVNPVPIGRNAEEDLAYSVLSAASWWDPKDKGQTWGAVRLLRQIVSEYGWPTAEVRRRIDVTPYTQVHDHLSLLSSLLRDCMQPYVLSAREYVMGEHEALVYCARCWRGLRRGQGARDGDLCQFCKEEDADGGDVDGVPLTAYVDAQVGEDAPF
ncbi:hypothetical protein [Streptomyces sp. NPDC058279]|uniref:hypothetical protein n=1 Tax=Streptomyces sp. NPDC058279 TaxID=3346418 RepID=UPI0036EE0C18